MSPIFELITVVAIVGLAAAYLIFRVYRFFTLKHAAACGTSCGDCSKSTTSGTAKPVVELSLPGSSLDSPASHSE